MPDRPISATARSGVTMIVLNGEDNIGVATRDIAAGETALEIMGRAVTAIESIPQGHKIALRPIGTDGVIVRCGVPVAVATTPIAEGALVHVHNVASRYINNDVDHYE